MKKLVFFLPLLALCGVLACMGCASTSSRGPAPLELGQDFSGKRVELKPGQTLVITLDSNPSTGYDWGVGKQNTELLSLEEDAYVPPENARIGQGGTHRFVFKALKQGSDVLELAYYRPWEGVEKAADWFQLIVEIY